jgi:hypothetical protein
MAIPPLVRWLAAPVWGAAADASHRHKFVMNGALLGMVTAMVLVTQVSGFGWLMAVVAGYAWFMAPVVPMADATVMAALGENKIAYTPLPVVGTIGFAWHRQ